MTAGREVHMVSDAAGTIVAAMEAAPTTGPGGVQLSSAPAPGRGHLTVALVLTDAHAKLALRDLVEDYEIDHGAESPALRRRSTR
jgi:hypothetical protein